MSVLSSQRRDYERALLSHEELARRLGTALAEAAEAAEQVSCLSL
jgi:hypothetical protein